MSEGKPSARAAAIIHPIRLNWRGDERLLDQVTEAITLLARNAEVEAAAYQRERDRHSLDNAKHAKVDVDLEAARQENERLRTALRFYANRDHWVREGSTAGKWDIVSGEADNWYWRDNETQEAEGIENGTIAAKALRGEPINWEDSEPPAIEGESTFPASSARG